jgi:curved DNA-binding protein CbpA
VLNYYKLLGISESASSEEIKAAFKKKAVQYHPDKHHGDVAMEEKFKEINTAYQTLSNPYKKSRYDLTLQFGGFQEPPPQRPYAYRSPPFRSAKHTKKFDSKANIKATFYAFLFAFIIGLIVKAGMWTLEYVRAEERAEILASRRIVYDQAQAAYKLGNLSNSLNYLDSLGYFYPSEADIRDYKDNILKTTITRANRHLKNENFQRAIEMFDIMESYSISASLDFKVKKAKAYKGVGDFQKTLDTYHELYRLGYRTTSFFYEIGLTYQEGAGNYIEALKFYEIAARYASSEYESSFGKAYPIMITPKHIPEYHYNIFMKLANAYYETGAYEKGIQSLDWTKEMWPDSAINYYISAKCNLGLNQKNIACSEFNLAKFKDASLVIPDLCY